MTWFKILLLLLVLLHTTRAQYDPRFFKSSLEEARKHASTLKESSYAASARSRQKARDSVFSVETSAEQVCSDVLKPD